MFALGGVLGLVYFFVFVAVVVVGGVWIARTVIEGNRKCPACRSRVPRKATVCAHCRTDLP